MKRLLIFFLILIGPQVMAQHKPIQFGFSAAPNIGWFSSQLQDYTNQGVKPGASWGFVSEIFVMEGYSINTGFNVIFLNGEMTMPWAEISPVDTLIYGKLNRIYKNKYVEIPFVFTMKTKEIKHKFRVYGQIGVGLSLLLNAKANDLFMSNDGKNNWETKNNQIPDMVRFTRESLILGTGIEIPLTGSTFLRAGLKYDNAFVNVLKQKNPSDNSVNNSGMNHFLALNITLIF